MEELNIWCRPCSRRMVPDGNGNYGCLGCEGNIQVKGTELEFQLRILDDRVEDLEKRVEQE